MEQGERLSTMEGWTVRDRGEEALCFLRVRALWREITLITLAAPAGYTQSTHFSI